MPALLTGALAAQEPDTIRASQDSLAARLERAEEAIELLRQQLAAQSESEVRTVSRVSLELTGRALVNAFANSGRVNTADVPQFVFADGADFPPSEDFARGSLGLSARQTTLGLIVSVAGIMGGDLIGDVHADFFSVLQPGSGGRVAPTARLRTLKAVVRWPNAELLVGQEVPLVAGLNPVSTASIGTPTFATAGNLWLWLPQIRATVQTGGALRLGLQAAVLAPNSGEPIAGTNRDRDVDVAERSRRPFVQGRVRAQWGSEERLGELGVGVHGGWFARPTVTGGRDAMHESWAVAADLLAPLGPLMLRAEIYRGALLRGLGGGAIGQNFAGDGSRLQDQGGWAQLDWRVRPTASLGAGCGVDDPRVARPASGSLRTRNAVCEAHLLLRPGGPFLLGLEARRMETTWVSAVERKFVSDHLNLAVGFEF
ncbi:MAG TPA: hypothetical protein VJ650_04030 [Gemmatimonadaceae bacterium]|nr:hypothetical protein [Gemmatimonadaceae bacterium]